MEAYEQVYHQFYSDIYTQFFKKVNSRINKLMAIIIGEEAEFIVADITDSREGLNELVLEYYKSIKM
ncbi:hypothetical protein [Orenia marismortui]|uniref:hypothetical protein n=1 Tax=Orenia marismortui TaxID=46469 RepID=UPI000378EB43|nr:hypothetical protein [Orenia marismortui]